MISSGSLTVLALELSSRSVLKLYHFLVGMQKRVKAGVNFKKVYLELHISCRKVQPFNALACSHLNIFRF